ncbi:MAG: diguanylate cyclase [Magnetococcales bacterium]|nr:diguanylate cyclase [Magnetococcales bacterium]
MAIHLIEILAFMTILVLLLREARKRPALAAKGFRAVLMGVGLLMVSGLAGAAEQMAWTDKSVYWPSLEELGRIGGFSLILVGLTRWIPAITTLDEVESFSKKMIEAYTRLELEWRKMKKDEEFSRSVSHSANDAIISTDSKGNIISWNRGAARMFGHTESEMLGNSVSPIIPERFRARHQAGLQRVATTGQAQILGKSLELVALRKNGLEFPVEISIATWSTGGERFFVGVIRDITHRKVAEAGTERTQQSRVAISALLQVALEPIPLQEQLEKALDIILSVPWLTIQSKGSIFLWDEERQELVMTVERGLAAHLLKACARIPAGYCLCGRAAETRSMVHAAHLDDRHDVRFDGIRPHGHYCLPILYQGKLLGVVNTYIADSHDADKEEMEFLQSIADTLAGLIERKRVEEKLEEMAHHDSLTGLPNRKLLEAQMVKYLARARRDHEQLALLFLDLDGFKQVNDTLGHEAGDKLLQEVARRIKGVLRDSDVVARLGGDEFMVLLPSVSKAEDTHFIARKIIDRLCEPVGIKGESAQIGTSIGISIFPEHGEMPEELMHKADLAMYRVKKEGKNHFRLFEPGMITSG